jgi:hypothetical protein
MIMDLTIPGICFLTSSIPLEFKTDGRVTRLEPAGAIDADHIMVLSNLYARQKGMSQIAGISLFDRISIPDDIAVPEIYDGTQMLCGKKVLVLMSNGWGDTILLQPAIRVLYRMAASSGDPPVITLGCNWIDNFPYPDADCIHEVIPNILTLAKLCSFDVLVNLMPLNYQRTAAHSLCELSLEMLGLRSEYGGSDTPFIRPDPARVARIKPFLERIRKETGRKLLCINWKSRFFHKDAPPSLLFRIANVLKPEYQAVLLKDEEASKVMQREIDDFDAPVVNLSSLVSDLHDTVAALSLVDTFVSVDTGIVHAAGAMGIPGVALFGPFLPETHVSVYPSVVPVSAGFRGRVCRGPCLETHAGCAEVGYAAGVPSPCFEAIDADDVIRALNTAVRRVDESIERAVLSKRYGRISRPETERTTNG